MSSYEITLTIPNRGLLAQIDTNMQIARLLLTLELQAEAGTSFGANYASLTNPPAALNGAGGFLESNRYELDEVSTSPRLIDIEITLLNHFDTPFSDPKNSEFSSGDRSITFTLELDSNISIVNHLLSSYFQPSEYATASPYRRSEVPRATFVSLEVDSVSQPVPPEADDRRPFNIMIVADRSGSMGISDTILGSSVSRIDFLNSAIEAFIGLWLSTESVAEDHLAVFSFSSASNVKLEPNSTGLPTPAGDALQNRAVWESQADALTGTVDMNISASGSTALGDGLTEAMMAWAQKDTFDGAVILMSDGMENDGQEIYSWDDPANPTTDPVVTGMEEKKFFNDPQTGSYQAIAEKGVLVQGVAIGTYGSSHAEELGDISTQTGGAADVVGAVIADAPASIAELYGALARRLVDILKGNTVSTLYQEWRIADGSSFNHPIDGSIKRVTVMMNWYESAQEEPRTDINQQAFLLSTSGDNVLLKPSGVRFGKQFSIYTYDLGDGPIASGDWRFEVTQNRQSESYYITILAVETRLSFRLSLSNNKVGVNDPIDLLLNASFGLEPVNDANVEVFVAKPGEGYGDLMHGADLNVEFNPDRPDSSLLSLRELALMQNKRYRDALIPTPMQNTFEMKRVADGLYGFQFTDTDVPGTYRFKILLTIERDGEQIQRIEERQVTVGILELDYAKSEFSIVQNMMIFIPHGVSGHILGPGHASKIQIVVDGKVFTLTDTSARGIYSIPLAQFGNASVEIRFRGKTFVQGTIEDIINGKGTVPNPDDNTPDPQPEPDPRPDPDPDPKSDPSSGGCLEMIIRLVRQIFGS